MKKKDLKKQNIKNTIRTSSYMLKMVLNKTGGKSYILLKLIIAVFDASIPLVIILFPGLIIDELINDQRIVFLTIYILALCGIPIINELIHIVLNKKIVKLKQNLDLAFSVDYYKHIADMDFELNESPKTQELKFRAQKTIEASVSIVDSLIGLITSFLRLIMVFSVIITMNPFLIILIILQVYINAIIAKWLNKKSYELDIKTSSFARKIYANTCVFDDNDYAKELRLFNLKDHFINLLVKNVRQENKHWFDFRRDQLFANGLTVFIKSIQLCVIYIYLAYSVIKSSLPIGRLTIYLASADQFSNALGLLVSSYVDLSGRSLKIDELIEFMSIPNKQLKSGKKKPYFDNSAFIEFKNVSFKYPGSELFALKNINLKFTCSERLCIVGANGSGKSTFVKLITRLYDPTEGVITLNGIDIKEYDYNQYKELFAPVFQDYQLLFMTLRENIILSKEVDESLLKKVYSETKLNDLISSLKYADETQVYKWACEDGFEPSGGEGQRIALGRALYHNRDIYLLDEPTASLDPNTEYELYLQFHNIIRNKSAILITHRLSAVQLADKVAVFDNGHIIEYGTHTELYNKGGKYTEMFDKQAKFYRDNPCENKNTD